MHEDLHILDEMKQIKRSQTPTKTTHLPKLLGIVTLGLSGCVCALVVTVATLPLALPALLLGRRVLALFVWRGVGLDDTTHHGHVAHGLSQTALLLVRHVLQPFVLPVRQRSDAIALGSAPSVVLAVVVGRIGILKLRNGDDGISTISGGVAMALPGRRGKVVDPVGVRNALVATLLFLLLAVLWCDLGRS